MSSIVQYMGQEWCNPKNVNLNGSGYVTQGTPDGLIVLCSVEKHTYIDDHAVASRQVIKYVPLKYEDLNIAD